MNSEREKRAQQAVEIENEILNYESAQETNAKTLAALRLAKEVLQETPRKLRNCEMSIHTFQPRGYQEADCSACGQTVIWEMDSKFCSKCGSSVVKAEKDYDPRERLERVAIKEAVNSIGGR